ncbi:hypothetical protein [Bacillus pseudomycoides]|uniref:hypothetical protein n=1 Tax=Bacillus pseudomycoides TaxID=64104 RepID=UPI001FB33352|nr:hypothetical protein [Bacillus pseudomycoides]
MKYLRVIICMCTLGIVMYSQISFASTNGDLPFLINNGKCPNLQELGDISSDKGLYEYVNPVAMDRYMIFNYITKEFKGELLEDTPEGKAVLVSIEEAYNLPKQESIRRRFPLFFEDGTFEIQVEWNHAENKKGKDTIKNT